MNVSPVLLLAIASLAAGCTTPMKGLAPKPTILHPPRTQPLTLQLAEGIKDAFLASAQFGKCASQRYRTDLSVGFRNGFSGAFELKDDAKLVLALDEADIALTCYSNVGCFASMKFRGFVADTQKKLTTPFSGHVQSGLYAGAELCEQAITEVIERMYEETTKPLFDLLTAPADAPSSAADTI